MDSAAKTDAFVIPNVQLIGNEEPRRSAPQNGRLRTSDIGTETTHLHRCDIRWCSLVSCAHKIDRSIGLNHHYEEEHDQRSRLRVAALAMLTNPRHSSFCCSSTSFKV
jgi:hypothetical protein